MSRHHQPLFVVGIAGGSGSGKTTIANALLGKLNSQFKISTSLLTMDYYYRDLSHLSFAEREQTNFDHPSSIENALLIQHLRDLKSGKSIRVPTYNFATHNRNAETRAMVPPDVLIVEGILLLADPELAALLDLKVFVDCAADVRLMRRLQRDVKERGRDVDSVCVQYAKTVQPMYDEFVAPSGKLAHIVVPNSAGEHDSYAAVVDLLASKARVFVSDHAQHQLQLQQQPQPKSPRLSSSPTGKPIEEAPPSVKRAKQQQMAA